jgi:glutathione peroxidase
MKHLLIFLTTFSLSLAGFAQQSIHEYTVKDIEGNDYNLSSLKGKKVMIVNTASKCGLTPQYKDLEALNKKYEDQNFIIIGFPANNFMNQEPGSNEEIAEFCEKNYGVTFPMMSKISVKGKDMHELYKWLTSKDLNGKMDSKVKWNFQKYLINPDGSLAKYFSPKTNPLDEEIIAWIEE